MVDVKKKLFPKLKKKIKAFLTDESWKITKKDALGLAVGVVMFGSISETLAGHSSSYTWLPWSNSHTNGVWWECSVTEKYSNHASWMVNWHYSSTIAWKTNGSCYWWTSGHWNTTHSNHGSHGSHGSWGRC